MLLTLSRAPRVALAVSLLTLVLASVATVVQPVHRPLDIPSGVGLPVVSLRPPAPTVVASDEHGLVVTAAEVRYRGLRVGGADEIVADAAALVAALEPDARAGQRDPMAGHYRLTIQVVGSPSAELLEAVSAAARAAGYDDVLHGGSPLHYLDSTAEAVAQLQ